MRKALSLGDNEFEFQYDSPDIGEEGSTQSPFEYSRMLSPGSFRSHFTILPSSNFEYTTSDMSDTSSLGVANNVATSETEGKAYDENVAPEATSRSDGYNIMSAEDIESTLKENFDEYKEDEENLRIATEAVDALQTVRLSISEQSLRNASGRWGRNSQVRTIAKGITSDFAKRRGKNGG